MVGQGTMPHAACSSTYQAIMGPRTSGSDSLSPDQRQNIAWVVQGRASSAHRCLAGCRAALHATLPCHLLLHVEYHALSALCHEGGRNSSAAAMSWHAAIDAAARCPLGPLQTVARQWLGGLHYRLGRLLLATGTMLLEGEAAMRQSLVAAHSTSPENNRGHVAGVRGCICFSDSLFRVMTRLEAHLRTSFSGCVSHSETCACSAAGSYRAISPRLFSVTAHNALWPH